MRRKRNYTKRTQWLWIVLGGGEKNRAFPDVEVVVGRIGENVGCGDCEDSRSVEDDEIGEECD